MGVRGGERRSATRLTRRSLRFRFQLQPVPDLARHHLRLRAFVHEYDGAHTVCSSRPLALATRSLST